MQICDELCSSPHSLQAQFILIQTFLQCNVPYGVDANGGCAPCIDAQCAQCIPNNSECEVVSITILQGINTTFFGLIHVQLWVIYSVSTLNTIQLLMQCKLWYGFDATGKCSPCIDAQCGSCSFNNSQCYVVSKAILKCINTALFVLFMLYNYEHFIPYPHWNTIHGLANY